MLSKSNESSQNHTAVQTFLVSSKDSLFLESSKLAWNFFADTFFRLETWRERIFVLYVGDRNLRPVLIFFSYRKKWYFDNSFKTPMMIIIIWKVSYAYWRLYFMVGWITTDHFTQFKIANGGTRSKTPSSGETNKYS